MGGAFFSTIKNRESVRTKNILQNTCRVFFILLLKVPVLSSVGKLAKTVDMWPTQNNPVTYG